MAEIETILLRAKKELYSYLNGHNLSTILGQGYDFAELREYQVGDDTRHISWINSAKLGQPYIKKMHEERELSVAVCSLMDGRFLLGEKREILMKSLAILGYSAYEANDLFLSLNLVGERVKLYPPSKDIEAVENALNDIYQAKLLNQRLDYAKVPSLLLERIEQKSLLFIVGDFLDPIDLSIVAEKHEVILLIIRDPEEEHPTPASNTQLINPQNSQALAQKLTPKAIKYYEAQRQAHDERLRKTAYRYGVRLIKIHKKDEVLARIIEVIS